MSNNDDEHPPSLPPLASLMKVDLLFNDDGGVWLLHDKPLSAILKWADYDVDTGTMTLTMAAGQTQPLGLAIPLSATAALKAAPDITVMLVKDQAVVDMAIIPLTVTGG